MQIETTLFVGWLAVPLIAYMAGRLALARLGHRPPPAAPDAAHRLEELRRRQAEGPGMRGRLGEARLLAESGNLSFPPRLSQETRGSVESPVVP